MSSKKNRNVNRSSNAAELAKIPEISGSEGARNPSSPYRPQRATPIARVEEPVVEAPAVEVAVEDAPVEAPTASERFVDRTGEKAPAGTKAAAKGKPRVAVVSGTNTWRDGFTPAVVKKWEDWASTGANDPKGLSFVAKVRAAVAEGKITCAIDDDKLLAEMCCAAWRAAGKGMNEAKLIKMVPLFVK